MTTDQLMGAGLRFNVSVEAAAALAARLELLAEGNDGDLVVTAQLDRVLALAGLTPLLADVDPDGARVVAGAIRANFLQAAELMANPGRAPGWVYDDPSILQGQGRNSSMIPGCIDASLDRLDGMAERLAEPGARFLDIGSGVSAMSCAVCRQWPAVEVVGIEPWEPSLALARQNVTDAGLDDRIELRHGVVEDVTDSDAFAMVWVPGPFLPPSVLPTALHVSRRALEPGGWVVLGLYAGPDDDLATALMDLRTVRSGGHLLSGEAAASQLVEAGFVDVAVLPRPWQAPVLLVVGRKPA